MVALLGESPVRYLARLNSLRPNSPRLNSPRLNSPRGCFLILLNGVGLMLLSSQPGWAHGAIATVSPTFSIAANYSSGEPMALAQVVVYSPDQPDQPWTTGQTNQEGEFEFSPNAAGNWEVVIRQAGHGTTVNVPVAMAPSTEQTEQPQTTAPTTAPTTAQKTTQKTASATPISSSSLQNSPLHSPLQRWASAGAALWGLVGTALFFSRGKQS